MLPFKTELFFAEYEFTTRYTLASSDCETLTIDALCALAGTDAAALLGEVALGYTEPLGSRGLREKIAARDLHTAPDDVVVLGAPVEGIYLLCRVLGARGGNIVALSPAYDALHNVAASETELRLWHMRAGDEWTLDIDALESLVDDETRAVVVNFPHNPTGYVPSEDELARIAAIARARGATLFCDEIYRGLSQVSAPPSAIDVDQSAIVLGGLSKAHGLPGLRAGWLTLKDDALKAEVMNWKNYTTICPPGPIEVLASLALGVETQLVERAQKIIAANLLAAEGFFGAHPAFVWRRPRGASVALVEVDAPALGHKSATALCHALAQEGVLLLPGDCLGAGDNFVRVGLGRTNFSEGLDALARAL